MNAFRLKNFSLAAAVAAALAMASAISIRAGTLPPLDLAAAPESRDSSPLALYWWADTQTPYWYKGKTLVIPSTAVHVMAIPTGREGFSPQSLFYSWVLDENIQNPDSGFGKQIFTFGTSFIAEQDHFVEVKVETAARALVGRKTIRIVNRSPQIGIYEVKPLKGTSYEKRLKEFFAPSGEPYDFTAVPFFFSAGQGLKYVWTLNNKDIIGEFTKPWLFTLESKSGQPSADYLSVRVEDGSRPPSSAGASLRINLE